MIYFNILVFPLLALLDLVFSYVLAFFIVNWWAPCFAVKSDFSDRGVAKSGYKLPRWLAWFDTFDADLDQGVRDKSISGPSPYRNRVKWLYRNCAYGFSYWCLGQPFVAASWRVLRYEETADQLTFLAVSTNGHFNLVASRLGWKVKLGWKAWNYYEKTTGGWNPQPWGPVWRVPFVISVSRAT